MKIQKFLHSCLLVEENGRRILIDPGTYSFIEGKILPEDLAPADIILITHEHADHFSPEAIRRIIARRPAKIFCTEGVQRVLVGAGIIASIARPGDVIEEDMLRVEVVAINHDGPLVGPIPQNVGFLINSKLFHPGDSINFPSQFSCKVLALPVAGPWVKLREALDAGVKMKPEMILPIHDGILKDFSLTSAYERSAKFLADAGIQFRPLNPGEVLDV